MSVICIHTELEEKRTAIYLTITDSLRCFVPVDPVICPSSWQLWINSSGFWAAKELSVWNHSSLYALRRGKTEACRAHTQSSNWNCTWKYSKLLWIGLTHTMGKAHMCRTSWRISVTKVSNCNSFLSAPFYWICWLLCIQIVKRRGGEKIEGKGA